MSGPTPDNRKCLICAVDGKILTEETRTARMLCLAVENQFLFERSGPECLAMIFFKKRKLAQPLTAQSLRRRMAELQEPLS